MGSHVGWLVAALCSVATLPAVAVAHDGHATPTPAGPLAGVSPIGAAVLSVGFLAVTSGLLLVREGVVSRRAAGAVVGVGALVLLAGSAIALLDV